MSDDEMKFKEVLKSLLVNINLPSGTTMDEFIDKNFIKLVNIFNKLGDLTSSNDPYYEIEENDPLYKDLILSLKPEDINNCVLPEHAKVAMIRFQNKFKTK